MPASISFTPDPPHKRLAVFCDGTWVGRETAVKGAPTTNIRQLANLIGTVHFTSAPSQDPTRVHPITPHQLYDDPDTIVAGYQEGCGTGRTFLEYLWNGATASDIGRECISVYKFIVTHFTLEHEIFLFGFSRGAFTARCVAGMINNVGIIKRLPEYSDADLDTLCFEAFRTYHSDRPDDHPASEQCKRQRRNADKVWQVARPIRMLGLIDTVGALGIPRLNAGVGFDWAPLEFFDTRVSSSVQHVFHAPALHDRLWMFQPCLVDPGSDCEDEEEQKQEDGTRKSKKNRPIIHETWFPGTHYDVGRQTFRFLRQNPANPIERALNVIPELFSQTIWPNQVLADAVLRWLIQGVQSVEVGVVNPLFPSAEKEVARITVRIKDAATTLHPPHTASSPSRAPLPSILGSGDIYASILSYAPGGLLYRAFHRLSTSLLRALNAVLPPLNIGTTLHAVVSWDPILKVVTAPSDRRVPGVRANLYAYTEAAECVVGGRECSLEDIARMKERSLEFVRGEGTGERLRVATSRTGGHAADTSAGEDTDGKHWRYPSRTAQTYWLWRRVFGEQDEAGKTQGVNGVKVEDGGRANGA